MLVLEKFLWLVSAFAMLNAVAAVALPSNDAVAGDVIANGTTTDVVPANTAVSSNETPDRDVCSGDFEFFNLTFCADFNYKRCVYRTKVSEMCHSFEEHPALDRQVNVLVLEPNVVCFLSPAYDCSRAALVTIETTFVRFMVPHGMSSYMCKKNYPPVEIDATTVKRDVDVSTDIGPANASSTDLVLTDGDTADWDVFYVYLCQEAEFHACLKVLFVSDQCYQAGAKVNPHIVKSFRIPHNAYCYISPYDDCRSLILIDSDVSNVSRYFKSRLMGMRCWLSD
ncbi:hypothetical protein BDY21DRAFT_335749 [Lineolata rhizophorae]|uniref:Uncharacterized protein n=1 Tax=Lineolata rhizophorae TaxID=578093 RepID=A0A6A6P9I4_9PEZI|nr:hypothetical protein BDY21DRAFT_335749 [Lineolata rhizophorae]